jgi:uncharacterized protein (DUF885 family)
MFVAIFSLLVGPAQAATADDEAFENLAQEYISDLGNFSPVFATLLGDHGADGQLDQVDDAARAETRTLLLDYLQALNGIDREQLSRANQVDAELLLHEVESSLWSLDVLQEWAWNPLYYVNLSGSAIYGLLARDFASIETRLVNAMSRLEQLPRFLEQARTSIEPARVPKIHAETAVQQKKSPGMPLPITRHGLKRSCCRGRTAISVLAQSCTTPSLRLH